MYTALTYIGGKYVPGELIEDLPEETAAWLLSAGAIREEAPAASAADNTAVIEEPEGVGDQEEIKAPEEEAPEEIDVMAGIVEEKPKRTRRKKT